MSPARRIPQAKPITDVPRFIDVITSAFHTTPLMTAFIVEIDDAQPPYPGRLETQRLRRHFEKGITDVSKSNAELVEAGDWSAVALWEPSDFDGPLFANTHTIAGPILTDWRKRVKQVKERYIGCDGDKFKPFYHLSFLARNPEAPHVPGAISAVVQPFLERAIEEQVPAWLEATTSYAVSVYEHFGFRVVEKIVLAAGKIDSQGWPLDGGEGVSAWCMIFDAHL